MDAENTLKAFSALSDIEKGAFMEQLREAGEMDTAEAAIKLRVTTAMLDSASHQAAIQFGIAELAKGEDDSDRLDILINMTKELRELIGVLIGLMEGLNGKDPLSSTEELDNDLVEAAVDSISGKR